MRYAIAATIVVVAAIATPATVAAVSGGTETPTCYEDQVMAWQGSSNTHAVCIDVDDPALRDAIADAARK